MNIICDKIIELLRKNLGESRKIKKFYFGNPTELAKADLPAILVQPLSKEVDQLDNVYDEMMLLPRKERERVHFMSPGPNRKRDRSVTYQGIADAMAEQWGNLDA